MPLAVVPPPMLPCACPLLVCVWHDSRLVHVALCLRYEVPAAGQEVPGAGPPAGCPSESMELRLRGEVGLRWRVAAPPADLCRDCGRLWLWCRLA